MRVVAITTSVALVVLVAACSDDPPAFSPTGSTRAEVSVKCGDALTCSTSCCAGTQERYVCANGNGECPPEPILVAQCDGPEDCTRTGPDAVCCFSWGSPGGQLATTAYCAGAGSCATEDEHVGNTVYLADVRVCHVDADCPSPRRCRLDPAFSSLHLCEPTPR